jgi:esterase/lipase superfamily enzyme
MPGFQVTRSRLPAFDQRLERATPEDLAVARRFADDIDAQLARSATPHIYVFIHGFNTSFAGNTMVAASLWHYLGRNGVMISYAWPSQNSLFQYSKDKATARVNTLGLRLFLWYLHQETQAERIHVIAHSAGSPIVVHALRETHMILHGTSSPSIQERSRFGQVVLAAPDMDVRNFSNAIFDGFDQVPEGVTIYVSTKDEALSISSAINGFARLGNPIEVMDPEDFETLRGSDTMQVIDVAQAQEEHGAGIGHSYYYDNPWVSADLLMLLRHGAKPLQRGLVRDDRTSMWIFRPDHVEHVLPAARRVYARDPERSADAPVTD